MPNLPIPGENSDKGLHVSFVGGGVALSTRKLPAKYMKVTKLQNEVGVNMPLLRSLVAAHKIAVHHRNNTELPPPLKKAATEAIEAVERLFALHLTFLKTLSTTGKDLSLKLAKAQESLKESQSVPPSQGSKASVRERVAFLNDLTQILQRASQGQQNYVMQQVSALAESEHYLERVHRQDRVTVNPPPPKAPKAKAPKKPTPTKSSPSIALPCVPLPPLEEGQALEADSPIPQ